MKGWSRIKERLSRADFAAAPILIGLDFDGTLSALVDSPEKAVLSSLTRRLLRALVRRRDIKVAVLSGRSLKDIKKRVGLPGVYYAGNHGLQIDGPLLRWAHPQAAALSEALSRGLKSDLEDIPGALVEHKGLGVSVHYRNVSKSRVRLLERRVRARFAGSRGVRVLRGKKALDIRSSVHWNKGHALEAIRAHLPGRWRGVFIGDDSTDEEGFRTLGERALTIRVGSGVSSAQYVLARRGQVDRLLGALAARTEAPRRSS
jgi:trehalose 6-phosphate phosphatase